MWKNVNKHFNLRSDFKNISKLKYILLYYKNLYLYNYTILTTFYIF